jgi:hypothetical protein
VGIKHKYITPLPDESREIVLLIPFVPDSSRHLETPYAYAHETKS